MFQRVLFLRLVMNVLLGLVKITCLSRAKNWHFLLVGQARERD